VSTTKNWLQQNVTTSNMTRTRRASGYTIVEVMIVLAVSSLMFLIAANFISGRQQSNAFRVGTNELAQRIQSTLEEVNDGQYSDIPLTCTVSGSGVPTASVPVGPASPTQGTNANGCVFMGKLMHFRVADVQTNYETFSLAGSQKDSTGKLATGYQSASPTVISGLTKSQTVPQNLNVQSVVAYNTVGATYHSFDIGFIQNFGQVDTSSGITSNSVYQNGAQSISLVYTTGLNNTSDSAAAAGSLTPSSNIIVAQAAYVCVTDDTYYARINIGGEQSGTGNQQNRLAVTVQVIDKATWTAQC